MNKNATTVKIINWTHDIGLKISFQSKADHQQMFTGYRGRGTSL